MSGEALSVPAPTGNEHNFSISPMEVTLPAPPAHRAEEQHMKAENPHDARAKQLARASSMPSQRAEEELRQSVKQLQPRTTSFVRKKPAVASIPKPTPPARKVYMCENVSVDVEARFTIEKKIGVGSYGTVFAAQDTNEAQPKKCAVKKLRNIFSDLVDGKRMLREIKLMRYLKHDNILSIAHIMMPRESMHDFKDLYVVTDLMETDLYRVIKSSQPLTPDHHQFLVYQMLSALHYSHSAGVMHRDIKPANILVNSNCDIKVCDFGLARGAVSQDCELTEYVFTRWYRPPELVLTCHYTYTCDVWAVGCILAELMNRKPLFPGKDYINQLKLTTALLDDETLEQQIDFADTNAPHVLDLVKDRKRVSLKQLIPSASSTALDLLSKMLAFHPKRRSSAVAAMRHPYFASIYDRADEKVMNSQDLCQMKWEHDLPKADIQESTLRRMFWEEITAFRQSH